MCCLLMLFGSYTTYLFVIVKSIYSTTFKGNIAGIRTKFSNESVTCIDLYQICTGLFLWLHELAL